MQGDFSRYTFDASKHYSRLLMQQGRVFLDADWNEMVELHLHYLRRLAADLIGPHGGPGEGFKIEPVGGLGNDFAIGNGHYYVDGILCENDPSQQLHYTKQPGFPSTSRLENNNTYLVYLDVWERHVTQIEDETEGKIGIREVALGQGSPDTASRTQVVWQVKCKSLTDPPPSPPDDFKTNYAAFLEILGELAPSRGQLRARARKAASDNNEPCLISPEAQYRGPENQLYRVESHQSGPAWDGMTDPNGQPAGNKDIAASFKWSRENGAVIFPIKPLAGRVVTLEHLGRDSRFSLTPDERRKYWVEIIDDDYVLQGRAEPLLQIEKIDHESLQVTLKAVPGSTVGQAADKHPLLRRWDHQAGNPRLGGPQLSNGAALVVESEGEADSAWLTLEDGVQIQFPKPSAGQNTYRTGDYWWLPARTATGDVEWPGPVGQPLAVPPHGVQHHYAPLAIVTVDGNGAVSLHANFPDLRREIIQLWK
jgi:hypothetical protein